MKLILLVFSLSVFSADAQKDFDLLTPLLENRDLQLALFDQFDTGRMDPRDFGYEKFLKESKRAKKFQIFFKVFLSSKRNYQARFREGTTQFNIIPSILDGTHGCQLFPEERGSVYFPVVEPLITIRRLKFSQHFLLPDCAPPGFNSAPTTREVAEDLAGNIVDPVDLSSVLIVSLPPIPLKAARVDSYDDGSNEELFVFLRRCPAGPPVSWNGLTEHNIHILKNSRETLEYLVLEDFAASEHALEPLLDLVQDLPRLRTLNVSCKLGNLDLAQQQQFDFDAIDLAVVPEDESDLNQTGRLIKTFFRDIGDEKTCVFNLSFTTLPTEDQIKVSSIILKKSGNN